MLSEKYSRYINDVINLARSLVIKSSYTATLNNTFLKMLGEETPLQEKDWKYYRNLAGEHYVGATDIASDKVFKVHSYDTNIDVFFKKSVLANHPITKNYYINDKNALKDLCSQYPESSILIMGIVHPVDTNDSVSANDHSILWFDKTYVGSNEESLISELQAWIYRYMTRWNINAFKLSSSLYAASQLSTMYLGLPTVIINLRLAKCKTREVHEFHLWSYLAGYFDLDKYRGILPYRQALFLYRNIEYISNNPGTKDTLDFLNTWFARPFGLRLFNHVAHTDRQNIYDRILLNDTSNLMPDIAFSRYEYGKDLSQANNNVTLSSKEMIFKLNDVGISNPEHIDDDAIDVNQRMYKSVSGTVQTGIIECEQVKSVTELMINRLYEKIKYWIFLSVTDRFNVDINIMVPSGINSNVGLSSKDAIALLIYSSEFLNGNKLVDVPVLFLKDVYTPPIETKDDLVVLVEKNVLKGKRYFGTSIAYEWNRGDDAAASPTAFTEIYSINEFNTLMDTVISRKFRHILLPTLEKSSLGKSELTALTNKYYIDYNCSPISETTYVDFFSRVNINIDDLTRHDHKAIIQLILKEYIGYNVNQKLNSPYAEMVEILRLLCSYTVAFVTGASMANQDPLDWSYASTQINGGIFHHKELLYNQGFKPVVLGFTGREINIIKINTMPVVIKLKAKSRYTVDANSVNINDLRYTESDILVTDGAQFTNPIE